MDKKPKRRFTFVEGLLLLFIGLKLTGYIEWSWWWVLAPMWGPITFALIVMIIYLTTGGTINELKRKIQPQSAPRPEEDSHPCRRIDPIVIHRSDNDGADS